MTQMQEVEDQLRRMILDMEIGPGERLTERWIESHLGTSRTSVRTALFRLQTEGLVQREGRGWMVSPIDLREIEELFVYREVLEVAAIRLGGESVEESMLLEIDAVLDSVNEDATPEQIDHAAQEFHRRIAELSQNEFISRGVADTMLRLQRARWLENDAQDYGWVEHRAIISALRKGEVERAAQLLESHTRAARKRLLFNLNKNQRSLRARGLTVIPVTKTGGPSSSQASDPSRRRELA